MSTKLALIDPDLLIRLLNNQNNPTPPANPTLQEIQRIDNNMQSILNDSKDDANVQMKKYNELLTKYDTQTDNFYNTPQAPPMKMNPVDEKTDRWAYTTIDALPKTMQRTGRLLLAHI